MWTNYIQMANEAHLGYETYELFDENGGFNLRDFEYKVQLLKHEQGRVLIVINDPCQNPTGYSMSYVEWISVIDILNSSMMQFIWKEIWHILIMISVALMLQEKILCYLKTLMKML